MSNKVVYLKLNGITYKAKTNIKGLAIFKFNKKVLNKLNVGRYIYKVTFGADVVSRMVTVRK